MSRSDLVPWARGPFELIRHANGHLQEAGDTDRRIALIGFDNAIEVCIDVFIKLHPKLHGGVELCRDEVERATRSYHTKIEWLDKYVEVNNLDIGFSIEEIVWYHSLRNELYHSGNGMIPEMHVLEGVRAAAVEVFNALFKKDITAILGGELPKHARPPEKLLFQAQNEEMEFLRIFIEFERTLEKSLKAISQRTELRSRGVRQMWNEYRTLVKTPPEWNVAVEKILTVRNNITHGNYVRIESYELENAFVDLFSLIEALSESLNATEKSKSIV